MDGRLACQTDVTPDARDLYGRGGDDCDDCRLELHLRGKGLGPLELLSEDDDLGQGGSIISLARAVLALGQRGLARAVPPGRAQADRDVDGDFGGH